MSRPSPAPRTPGRPVAGDGGAAAPASPGGWPAWSAVLAPVLAITATVAIGIVLSGVLVASGAHPARHKGPINLVLTFIQDGAFIVVAVMLARRFGPLRAADFALRPVPLRRALQWMAAAVGAYLSFELVYGLAVHPPNDRNLVRELGVGQSAVGVAALAVLATVVAPIAEEILFRGYMFGALRGRLGGWRAAAAVGLMFGAVHGLSTPALLLVPLALLGFVLCVVRWRTGSLFPCVSLHSINNCVAFGVLEHWAAGEVVLLALGAHLLAGALLAPFGARARLAPAM